MRADFMLDAPRDYDEFTGAYSYGLISQVNIECAFEHEEQLVLIFMRMPGDFVAFTTHQFYLLTV